MNWSKVKSIMLAFLVLVNLSLLSYIVYEEILDNKRTSQMTDTICSLLSSRDISVNKELVLDSAKKTTAKSLYVDNVISDYKTFSVSVLGENAIMVSPDKYKSDYGEISFKGDYFKADAIDGNALYKEKTNKVNASRIAEKYLSELGFDTKKSEKNVVLENDIIKVSFNKKINNLPVFKIGVSLEMNESGITSIYGSWYNISEQNSSIAELKSISGVLVEYMNKKTGASEISDIQLGYLVPEFGTFHESILLTPVWKISDANDDTTYIDARENN